MKDGYKVIEYLQLRDYISDNYPGYPKPTKRKPIPEDPLADYICNSEEFGNSRYLSLHQLLPDLSEVDEGKAYEFLPQIMIDIVRWMYLELPYLFSYYEGGEDRDWDKSILVHVSW